MKKAIVTGANGFIGSWLIKELVKNKIEVYAIVKNENSNIDNLKKLSNINIIYCDLCDINILPELIDDRNFDVFYHMAWVGSSGIFRGDYNIQLDYVRYSCEAIEVASKLNCKKFIFASSLMEYEAHELMKTQKCPSKGYIYNAGKIAANYMCRTLANELKIEYISAIISNAYGPYENSPRLINTTIRKILNGEETQFTSGEQLYDFIYVKDVAKAFYMLGLYGKNNKSYYIGNEKQRKLKEFLLEINNIIGSKNELGLGKIPFNGISLTFNEFDRFMLNKDTGFKPKYTFEKGIRETIDWIKGEIVDGI